MVEEGPVDSNPGVDLVGSSRRLEEDRRTFLWKKRWRRGCLYMARCGRNIEVLERSQIRMANK